MYRNCEINDTSGNNGNNELNEINVPQISQFEIRNSKCRISGTNDNSESNEINVLSSFQVFSACKYIRKFGAEEEDICGVI